MVSAPDQSNGLSMCNSYNAYGSFFDSPKDLCEGIDGEIIVLQLFGAWIMCTDIPQKYRAAVNIFISSLYINFKHLILFSGHSLGSINAA